MAKSLLSARQVFNIISLRSMATAKTSEGLVKPQLAVFGIDGRYATALYSAAAKQNKLDVIEKDLNQLNSLVQKDAPFRELLSNPLVKVCF